MSMLRSYRSQLQRERDNAAKDQRKIADLSSQITRKRGEMSRTKVQSRQRSLSRDLDRLDNQRTKAQQSLASRQRKIASLEEKVAREEAREQTRAAAVDRKEARAQEQRERQVQRRLDENAAVLGDLESRVSGLEVAFLDDVRAAVAADPVRRAHDVFLSHAGPDSDVAQQLYDELIARGLDVWFDGAELKLGESLMRQIDRGIAQSRCGVILITETYLRGREWTEREAGALVTGRRRVIPILDGISYEDLAQYSPILSSLVGLSTERQGFDEIAEDIANALTG
jgi:hypothetical protein